MLRRNSMSLRRMEEVRETLARAAFSASSEVRTVSSLAA